MAKTKQPRKKAKPTCPLSDDRSYPTGKGETRPADSAASGPPKPRLRYDQPYGAKLVARTLLHFAMDWDAAIHFIVADWGKTDYEIAELVENCQQAPLVQKAVEAELTSRGLDEGSKDSYVKLMWEWLHTGNEAERLKAATILGKGFVGERVTVDKPMPLPIEGLNAGVTEMLRVSESDSAAIEDAESSSEETVN